MKTTIIKTIFVLSACITRAEATNDPMQIIEQFFTQISAPAGATNVPSIFIDIEAVQFAKYYDKGRTTSATKEDCQKFVLDYFRSRNRVFATPRESPADFWRHAGKWYMVRGDNPLTNHPSDSLMVVLTGEWKFSKRIFKEVRLMLEKTTDGWRISPVGIYINGVGFPANDVDQSYERWDFRHLFNLSGNTNILSGGAGEER